MISPPKYLDVVTQQWAAILEAYEKLVPRDAYLHWHELGQQPEPDGISREAWWAALKLARSSRLRAIPLNDQNGHRFGFCVPEGLSELLHKLDRRRVEEEVRIDSTERSIAHALREESIGSAILAGVTGPCENAQEMLRTNREPRNEGERAICNLLRALEMTREMREQPLSPTEIMALNQCITRGALADPGGIHGNDEGSSVKGLSRAGGRGRAPAELRTECLESICSFANGQTPDFFVHPLIRAIILHFWLLHARPFPNGNRRTARALFHWAMLHQGYPFFAFVAISPVLLRAPDRYARAVEQVETDDNDLTYFILHQAGVISEALEAFSERVERQTRELREAGAKLKGFAGLNSRQQAVMVHALCNPDSHYLIAGHQRSHGVTHQTARDDLFDLERRELLMVGKEGRSYVFSVPSDLLRRLQATGGRRRAATVSFSDELPTNLL